MSKITEGVQDANLIDVTKIQELPKLFVPFRSVQDARDAHPHATIYRYTGKPTGWQIIAVSITKSPEEYRAEREQ